MAKKIFKFPLIPSLKKVKPYLIPISLFIILVFLLILTYQVFMQNKFFPRTLIGDSDISFLTYSQAANKLSRHLSQRMQQTLSFQYQEKTYDIDLIKTSPKFDYSILDKALVVGHNNHLIQMVSDQIKALILSNSFFPQITLNLDPQTEAIAKEVFKAPQNAQLNFDETTTKEGSPSAQITLTESVNGQKLNKESLKETIIQYLAFGTYDPILPIKTVKPTITYGQVKRAKLILENIQKQPIQLKFAEYEYTLDVKQLLTLINLEGDSESLLDQEKTATFLTTIAQEIDQPIQEGLFEFNPQNGRVSAFKPSQEGRRLDLDQTYTLLSDALINNVSLVNLVVSVIKPKIQTEDVNNLGIKELIGRGISHFAGSIANRIYNIGLASSRINGVLIAPGEIFSFNATVGDISAASGYKQAYVIKEGRTVLDDGGGVCQVSTTIFRSVLNSGLPVIQRVAHAYRVGYYEQGFPPGLDATIFSPSVDFKFKNDTPAHILIQSYIVGNSLYVDFYGTSDGRVANITKSVVTNLSPPPPELRQDDPNLPKGEVKQVDWPAWGANVSFSRTVKRAGEVLIQETFRSNFKAWQAVFLVGTKEN
ncbi:MAG: VanW family protein [Candidatus Daviesbacteria bacterium]|nr:VanW family protein [Candidatus Daviesbacteria bacterium]